MLRPSFRAKLLASHVGLVVAAMLIAALVLDRSLASDLRRQLDRRLENQARGAAQWIIAGRHPERLAMRIAEVVDARVQILDLQGNVMGDSVHDGRAEDLYSVQVAAGDELIVRLGVPRSEIDAPLAASRRRIALATALAVAAALGLGLLASRAAARPLGRMTEAAQRLARGDYEVRLASTSPDEFGLLSRTLDSLAGELEARIGDLTRERDRLSSILAGMVEGVLVVGSDARVLEANPAVARILAVVPPLVGRPLAEVVSDPRLRELLERVTADGQPVEAELDARAAGDRLLAVNARPLKRASGGASAGIVAVLHDVTHLRRLETMRRDFVANVSHELRTPVAAIQGYAETLLGGGGDEATRRGFLEVIHRHGQRLGRLVEDLLKLSELEARPTDRAAQREPVDVGAVAGHVAETVRARAQAAQMRVAVDVPGGLLASGDAQSLEQVVENLVDNALKYARRPERAGEIRVLARNGGDRITLAIEDDGPGVEAHHLPRMFERFYRVDAGRSREVGGTGLGLAIVKHLVEAMGGTIRVESELGRGCRFTLDLAAHRKSNG